MLKAFTLIPISNSILVMASLFLKGTTPGDGTVIGTCPTSPSDLKCQPDGDCQVCNYISGTYLGCAITSTTPVCDSDASANGIQADFSTPATTRECVACKKSGKIGWEM